MTRYNAHRVFADAPSNTDFIHNITLPPKRVDELRKAREMIRATLRDALPNWDRFVQSRVLFEAVTPEGAPPSVSRPKFRMQGSMAYDTLNEPARVPPQEIDVDDGMFLPISYFEKQGHLHPSVASAGLFALVEAALQPLCAARGWTLDRSKPTCVRVITGQSAHVDLALYAIPDQDFEVLIEAAAMDAADEAAMAEDALELTERLYKRMPHDHIMLAHRTEDWKPSDPRKLEEWFLAAVQNYGPQLRRVCRYGKAWRDLQWEKCRLSSIALMRCVVDAYTKLGTSIPPSRDDLALLRVFELTSTILARRIENPVVKGQFLDEGWTPEQRQDYVARAASLAALIKAALNTPHGATDLLDKLSEGFGTRIPDDVGLVRDDESVPSSGLLAQLGDTTTAHEAVQKHGGGRYA